MRVKSYDMIYETIFNGYFETNPTPTNTEKSSALKKCTMTGNIQQTNGIPTSKEITKTYLGQEIEMYKSIMIKSIIDFFYMIQHQVQIKLTSNNAR